MHLNCEHSSIDSSVRHARSVFILTVDKIVVLTSLVVSVSPNSCSHVPNGGNELNIKTEKQQTNHLTSVYAAYKLVFVKKYCER